MTATNWFVIPSFCEPFVGDAAVTLLGYGVKVFCQSRGSSPTVREGSEVDVRALPDGRASAQLREPSGSNTQLPSYPLLIELEPGSLTV